MSKFSGLGLAVNETRRMELKHPVTGEVIIKASTGKPAYIEGVSSDSDRAKKFSKQVRNKMLDRRKGIKRTADEIDAEGIQLLAALTTGWDLADLNGNDIPVEHSEGEARELFSMTEASWLTEQWDEFVSARGNFSKS